MELSFLQKRSYLKKLPLVAELDIPTLDVKKAKRRFVPWRKKEGFHNAVYLIQGNMLDFHPSNDGMPTYSIYWYETKRNKKVIDNRTNFSEITNLEDVLVTTTKVMEATMDSAVVINPYGNFLLQLIDEPLSSYRGRAKLALIDNDPPKKRENGKLRKIKNSETIEEAQSDLANEYLDHFIGWNFGHVVRRNKPLRDLLTSLNIRLIETGRRKHAGSGLEVGEPYTAPEESWSYEFPAALD